MSSFEALSSQTALAQRVEPGLAERAEPTLAQRIDQAIQTNPYTSGRLFHFQTDGSRVVLQG